MVIPLNVIDENCALIEFPCSEIVRALYDLYRQVTLIVTADPYAIAHNKIFFDSTSRVNSHQQAFTASNDSQIQYSSQCQRIKQPRRPAHPHPR
jgi:hypothetical protein